MIGIFGTAAKKTAQALDLIEKDQPTAEEIAEAQEVVDSALEENYMWMLRPEKVGLIEPIIIDPQVIFERLTELFGVYKGIKSVHHMECTDCAHEWDEATSPDIDWDESYIECPDCGCDDTFYNSHNGKGVSHITSRKPTQEEVEFVTGRDLRWDWQFEGVVRRLLHVFVALTGNMPKHADGDEVDEDYIINCLLEYRNIKSLSEMNQVSDDEEGYTADDI